MLEENKVFKFTSGLMCVYSALHTHSYASKLLRSVITDMRSSVSFRVHRTETTDMTTAQFYFYKENTMKQCET